MINSRTSRWLPLAAGLFVSQAALAQPPEWRSWGTGSQPATQTPGSIPESAQSGADSLSDGSRGTSTILMELIDRVDQLEQELRALRGQSEVQTNEIERLQRALRDGFVDLDGRVSLLEGGDAAASSEDSGEQPSSGSGTQSGDEASQPAEPEAQPEAESKRESKPESEPERAPSNRPPSESEPVDETADQRALYDRAFALLRDGKYDQAIVAFDRTVRADPVGNWAPHALYWKGEAEYVNQDQEAARASFEKVLSDYPNSGRAADASLKIAYLDYDQGEYDKARERLERLVELHGGSHAAGLARQRLERMNREGL
ncbi:MAG: tetratricopeptide repeat protein [Halothiobacillaceae bacterium]